MKETEKQKGKLAIKALHHLVLTLSCLARPSMPLITLAQKGLSLHTRCLISTCPNPTHSSKHGLKVTFSLILQLKVISPSSL